MILTIGEAKSYIKTENSDEDVEIMDLIEASELYLKNATGREFDNTNPLAKLYCKVLVSDWYENRTLMQENKISEKIRFTLQSIIMQLKYCE